MKIYQLRKNIYYNNEFIKSKIVFKTRSSHWLNTDAPVIIPLSIQSSFHEGIEGELKMNALISTIRNHVKGKITVLLTERAHLQVLSLKYQNDKEKAFQDILKQAYSLANRFKAYFEGCQIVYWHQYINEDPCYGECAKKIRALYETDEMLRRYVNEDAERTYTCERRMQCPQQDIFIQHAIQDILEYCTYFLVIVNKSYRFQFYPGHEYASIQYLNQTLHPQISLVNVFLAIEKKVFTPMCRSDK